MKDEIFKEPIKKQFEFDKSVASVFDDMISRSVPFYRESSNLICDLLSRILSQNAKCVDLGCSTAELLLNLHQKRDDLNLFGVDNSPSMLEIAAAKATAYGAKINFSCEDILECDFKSADCVILNYTLQFIRPIKRAEFMRKICENLSDNGVFIFSEKLVYSDKTLSKEMIEIYENYKENQGYSKYEIAEKRKALENVLIPYTEDENKTLALNSGFKSVETIFKWANFAVFLARK
ncbi:MULTISPECIES: carboxy-S-adenosyl-L-methionine synthase CmoA [unclassified Campylobacter]|uniref:carboxy-S-adenosyl-L-methionine synthase CmoA n=1 Tax=unclassified Campylobacter TaxID=2593542 RepID=UPI0022E9C8D9|nr:MULTISPECIES: carboxy-S-adenosyl-L-methionine synthase CmoA [unclassified Campylobacter]MDA3055776.1 carboxy-S-adenosyl-L-methionine synthase CmoA [Campylobacter sp. CN_NA1]MDA3064960.1 carboxy-S-adenosyl-L-methionine synthase CmoA [Campylobacter sp. CN_NE4]MDA3068632.1 carboxy-S-adenosyl-L-methionine synthase CmoA [Campylobacter sp. CN_NE3]MDA3082045.1 carboxy-S-adenosyl-L-methionine synthase CmoA [Campylobacter sp. CN_EL2]MDA3084217.1 carboxy-S-adenosyl-L-methionine synthase CmoA [Campylo